MKITPTRDNNFAWLLIALVLLLFFSALFAELHLEEAHFLVNSSLVVTVLIAVWSLHSDQNKLFIPKVVIAAVIVVLMIVDSSISSNALASAQLLGMLLFVGLSIQIAWKQVMFTGDITRNTILGSVCIYLLIGLWFGFAYMTVEYFLPGSLKGLESEHWQRNLGVVSYYSLVTLTTLGYGDISPAGPLARFLASIESVIGIFYTTVLVASLIGMRLAGYTKEKMK